MSFIERRLDWEDGAKPCTFHLRPDPEHLFNYIVYVPRNGHGTVLERIGFIAAHDNAGYGDLAYQCRLSKWDDWTTVPANTPDQLLLCLHNMWTQEGGEQ